MNEGKIKKRVSVLLVFVLMYGSGLYAQESPENDRMPAIERQLASLADSVAPGLNEKVAASVSGSNIQEFVRGLAISNNLNISVNPDLRVKITVNFANETVQNILLFLCKQYELDIEFTGSIMYITAFERPPPEEPAPRELAIVYNASADQLSMDLKLDSLYNVIRKTTQLSGKNILLSPEVGNQLVSVFLKDLPFENALDKLGFANQLVLTKTADNIFVFARADKANDDEDKNRRDGTLRPDISQDFFLEVLKDVNGNHLVTINSINTPIVDLIKIICQELGINYFLFSEPKESTTVNVTNMPLDNFMALVLRGTAFTCKKEGGVYLIGDRNQEGFTNTRLIKLQHRSTEIVVENIPAELKDGVDIKDFPELNSLIVSGSDIGVAALEAFITQIDQIVPVIMIEVIIVDVSSSRSVSTDLSAGLADQPVSTSGTVAPGVDMTFGGQSINKLLGIINGGGVFNLGKVTPNFYVSIKAMEEQGLIKVRSTPKLSTLNSHEATLSIGATDYYVEQTNNVIGTQNPQTIVTRTFKPIEANFSLTINPVVSGDDQVTLSITVEQSDFTSRIAPDAPPGSATRQFESLIRVRNEEMVVLGGLEEYEQGETGRGLPGLSRIPVLKWLFSSREKTKRKAKLNIFIKPTIIY